MIKRDAVYSISCPRPASVRSLFYSTLIILQFATAFPGTAGPITSCGDIPYSREHSSSTAGETTVWSQLPTGYPLASQYFPDLYPNYDSGVAVDIQFDETTCFSEIYWWGDYWNGTTTPPILASLEIYIYEDDGTGNAPTLPQHTSAVRSYSFEAGAYWEEEDGDYWRCRCYLPYPFYCLGGQKYWIEIRKVMPFNPDGQWGWCASEPVIMSPCVQGFDGLGVEWWTPQETDVALELIFIWPPALERTTWADIKSTF